MRTEYRVFINYDSEYVGAGTSVLLLTTDEKYAAPWEIHIKAAALQV